jgi:hypothetical protein
VKGSEQLMRVAAWILVIYVVGAGLCACGLQKNRAEVVLKNEDFIADPTTTPTELPPSSTVLAPAGAPAEGSTAARPGRATQAAPETSDLIATVGTPQLAAGVVPAVGAPVLIDGKVGEINGRPVRVQEMLEEVGARLGAIARSRTVTEDDLKYLRLRANPGSLTRSSWLDLSRAAFAAALDGILQDELLQAEGRASLKPEQQIGLRYMVQEFSEQERRRVGGSRAQLTRTLAESGTPRTVEQMRREREAALLIQYQLEEKIRKRVRVSWKDVRLWYERNFERYNPPARAKFRMIQVDAGKADAIARVDAALRAGEPFETVARTADNEHEPEKGGEWGVVEVKGRLGEEVLFREPLNSAATGLEPGRWAGPVDMGNTKTWVYLESLEREGRPLSDRDVQLSIAQELNDGGFRAEQERYLRQLRQRADTGEIPAMAQRLTEIAAQRYWPEQ